jgi:hypothetical protein
VRQERADLGPREAERPGPAATNRVHETQYLKVQDHPEVPLVGVHDRE